MKLTSAEEQVMKYLWSLKKAFMKDLVQEFPEPRPAYTTIATLLKRMIDKGFVSFTQYGKVREYYPLVDKSDYFSTHMHTIIKDFFNNSTSQFASFFANDADLDLTQLEELKDIVEKGIQKQKNTKKND